MALLLHALSLDDHTSLNMGILTITENSSNRKLRENGNIEHWALYRNFRICISNSIFVIQHNPDDELARLKTGN